MKTIKARLLTLAHDYKLVEASYTKEEARNSGAIDGRKWAIYDNGVMLYGWYYNFRECANRFSTVISYAEIDR